MKKPAFLLFFSLLLLPFPSYAQNADSTDPSELPQYDMEFVAWSEDSKYVLLKIQDANRPGFLFQVRDTRGDLLMMGKKPAVFPSDFPSMSKQELAFIRSIRNSKVRVDGQVIKFTQEGVPGAVPPKKSDIMMLTGQKDDELQIIGIRDGQATLYDSIKLLKDKSEVAEANQKAFIWDDGGRNFILIYKQKLEKSEHPFSGDFISIHRFRSYKVKGPSDD